MAIADVPAHGFPFFFDPDGYGVDTGELEHIAYARVGHGYRGIGRTSVGQIGFDFFAVRAMFGEDKIGAVFLHCRVVFRDGKHCKSAKKGDNDSRDAQRLFGTVKERDKQ